MESLKILHRIYFDFNGKPDSCKKFLQTWEEQLPDYKIMHWNADNLPMDICNYTQKLFEQKDHAFLSDYFRWWVLKEYGGIYLDTDIEIVNGQLFNSLVEELENTDEYHSFIGVESSDYQGYTASMACKKNSPLAVFMCDIYENMGNLYHLRKKTSAVYSPRMLQLYFYEKNLDSDYGMYHTSVPIIIENVKIYPCEYFSPLKYAQPICFNKGIDLNNCCLCHHFNGSWIHENTIEKRSKMFKDYLNEETALKNKPKIIKLFSFCIRLVKKILLFISRLPEKLKNI